MRELEAEETSGRNLGVVGCNRTPTSAIIATSSCSFSTIPTRPKAFKQSSLIAAAIVASTAYPCRVTTIASTSLWSADTPDWLAVRDEYWKDV